MLKALAFFIAQIFVAALVLAITRLGAEALAVVAGAILGIVGSSLFFAFVLVIAKQRRG